MGARTVCGGQRRRLGSGARTRRHEWATYIGPHLLKTVWTSSRGRVVRTSTSRLVGGTMVRD